jgi:type IV secretory pathway VirB10-like protein
VRDAPDVPTKNWNDQKAVLTGYTQPGDKYFATRQRLAYHPRDKTFASPGLGPTTSSKQTAPPPPPPKPAETAPPPPPQQQKSAKEQSLEDYEKGYLERYAKEKEEKAKQAEAKKQSQASAQNASKRGAMPKGF